MSTTRLNAEERLAYAIGKTILETLRTETGDPDRQRDIHAIMQLLEAVLPAADFRELISETGAISEDVYDEIMGLPYQEPKPASPTENGPDDDIPF